MGRINPRRGEIPSELGWLVDALDDLDTRVDTLETPDGSLRNDAVGKILRTVEYLAGLVTYGANPAGSLSTGTVANDNAFHWFATSPETRIEAPAPTSKLLVTASVGEASVTPGGSFVIGSISYSVVDRNGVTIPGHGIGSRTGRVYTNVRLGQSISTGPQEVSIDPVLNPGPYLIRLYCGMWVASANTTACSATFNSPALVVQVIGDGVPE